MNNEDLRITFVIPSNETLDVQMISVFKKVVGNIKTDMYLTPTEKRAAFNYMAELLKGVDDE